MSQHAVPTTKILQLFTDNETKNNIKTFHQRCIQNKKKLKEFEQQEG